MKLIPAIAAVVLPLVAFPSLAAPLSPSPLSAAASSSALNPAAAYPSSAIGSLPNSVASSIRYSRGTGRREQCYFAPASQSNQSWCGGKLISEPTHNPTSTL